MIKKEIFKKEELQVDTDYFKRFAEANPIPISPVGLHHVNLKSASEEIRNANKALKLVGFLNKL